MRLFELGVQGDPTGHPTGPGLHFVNFDFAVPPCCPLAMPILPDFQLPRYNNRADIGSCKSRLTKQNVVSDLREQQITLKAFLKIKGTTLYLGLATGARSARTASTSSRSPTKPTSPYGLTRRRRAAANLQSATSSEFAARNRETQARRRSETCQCQVIL